MQIFNITIGGITKRNFCEMSPEDKKAWIKENTEVQDDAQIEAFLAKPTQQYQTGCCGQLIKIDNNESSGISKEVAAVSEPIETTSIDAPDHSERPNKPKRRKG